MHSHPCFQAIMTGFLGRAFLANYALMSQSASEQNPTSSQPASSNDESQPASLENESAREAPRLPKEIGGRIGPEPTRFGDWEKAGRCIDF
jgi:hypothetical protein